MVHCFAVCTANLQFLESTRPIEEQLAIEMRPMPMDFFAEMDDQPSTVAMDVDDGDPLEIRTRVEKVFVDGRSVDPDDNKHHRLYERYRSRPEIAEGS